MKELRDQSAHALTLCVLLLPVLLWPNVLTGAWAGFVAGMIRETAEEAPAISLGSVIAALGSVRDLTCWTLTGAVLGALL